MKRIGICILGASLYNNSLGKHGISRIDFGMRLCKHFEAKGHQVFLGISGTHHETEIMQNYLYDPHNRICDVVDQTSWCTRNHPRGVAESFATIGEPLDSLDWLIIITSYADHRTRTGIAFRQYRATRLNGRPRLHVLHTNLPIRPKTHYREVCKIFLNQRFPGLCDWFANRGRRNYLESSDLSIEKLT